MKCVPSRLERVDATGVRRGGMCLSRGRHCEDRSGSKTRGCDKVYHRGRGPRDVLVDTCHRIPVLEVMIDVTFLRSLRMEESGFPRIQYSF